MLRAFVRNQQHRCLALTRYQSAHQVGKPFFYSESKVLDLALYYPKRCRIVHAAINWSDHDRSADAVDQGRLFWRYRHWLMNHRDPFVLDYLTNHSPLSQLSYDMTNAIVKLASPMSKNRPNCHIKRCNNELETKIIRSPSRGNIVPILGGCARVLPVTLECCADGKPDSTAEPE